MERKYTPGPWFVGNHPALPHLGVVKPVLMGPHVHVLANHEGGHVGLHMPNAHLIAAAPELYEALEAMTETVNAMLGHAYMRPDAPPTRKAQLDTDLTNAQAALAKARGEAQ